ncbi:MAG TPA: electron transfer flavoprotein subunit alpha/FixB family protein [Pseudothermotoga sp.]|nr:electron transfer flavoprotein subunit alpha/FixB family protein [Pseudothermotoga sp.]HOK84001.1 electron transfer flavoprotein subunit alpha/FixB family protein [Pseudothermotoga sp.]HPP70984.1 electron transfer flavoprotein subunit alpha/FixB family protein [Pseudothermotoga sp.]
MIGVVNNQIDKNTLELLGKANQMAVKIQTQVCLFIIGSKELKVDHVKDYADLTVLMLSENFGRFSLYPFLINLEKAILKYRPSILLSPATTFGRTIMPALAARLRTGLTADCTDLDVDDKGNLLQTRPAIGGNVMATIITPNHRPQMATVRPRSFSVQPEKREGRVRIEEITELEDSCELIKIEKREPSAQIDQAQIVVSVGKGLRRKENTQIAEKLAQLVSGAVGATRSVVDAKWFSHDHQVGLSGKTVKPKVYIAAGISGAVQHIAGMQTSEIVIAINKDRYAPIFKVADIGLVADAYSTLEQIVKILEDESDA